MCSRSMPGGGQELRRLPGARHPLDREPGDRRMLLQVGQRREHRLAETALGPVVLDGDDGPVAAAASRSPSTSIGFTE